MGIKHISALEKLMTDEQKANETLDEYYAEGEKYLRKVDLENWDEENKE